MLHKGRRIQLLVRSPLICLEAIIWPRYHLFSIQLSDQNIARIANAVQVTICLLVSTSVY